MIKNIKNFLICAFAIILSVGTLLGLSACSTQNKDNRISIVCTIFPEYDWARAIIGEQKDNWELTLLLSNGTDLHNYQPTVADFAKISTADIFIYVGGESDEWVDDALKNATNKSMIVINLLEVLGDNAKEETLKEGMQGEEDEADEDETAVEYDEHV